MIGKKNKTGGVQPRETETGGRARESAARLIAAAEKLFGEGWLDALAAELETRAERGADPGAAQPGIGAAQPAQQYTSPYMQQYTSPYMQQYTSPYMQPYMPPQAARYPVRGSVPYAPPQGMTPQTMRYPMPYGMRGSVPFAPPRERDAEEERSGRNERDIRREGELLEKAVPEFELEEAMKNETFSKAIEDGMSVLEAYAEMTRMPKTPQRGEIEQNGRASRRGSGESSVNPAKLETSDFMKYINRIKNS